jgi:hypothetical protein
MAFGTELALASCSIIAAWGRYDVAHEALVYLDFDWTFSASAASTTATPSRNSRY